MRLAIFTDPHLGAYENKLLEFEIFIKNIAPQVDGFICAGDWSLHSVLEIEASFKTFREATDKPLYTVFGNHDYWIDKALGWRIDDIINYHDEMCVKYQITNLNVTPLNTPEVFISGFDGWYSRQTSSTSDYSHIPIQNSLGGTIFHFLKRREQISLDSVLKEVESIKEERKTKICVTHFGWHHDLEFRDWEANPNHLPILKEYFDMLIVGHSHREMDAIEGKTRIINAGAEYFTSPGAYCKIIEI